MERKQYVLVNHQDKIESTEDPMQSAFVETALDWWLELLGSICIR